MKKFLALIIIFFFPSISLSEIIIGGEFFYTVVKGDSIDLISSRFGVNRNSIIKDNNLDIKKTISIGQELKINNRKIVPKIVENGIIVNIPDRMLYYFKNGHLEMAFPVGLGMPSWRGITRWRTPTGTFKIITKKKNPTWHVPESMQWKMRMEGKPVKTIVPPGPDNPLGRFAMGTSIPGIVIHETIWPTTVYHFRSHGCIRVMPENMEKFFEIVEINTTGELIYNPVKVALSGNRIYLEVHKDIYGKLKDLNVETMRIIDEMGLSERVDLVKMNKVIKEKTGIAEDITL